MEATHTPWPDSGQPLEAFQKEIRCAGRLVGGCSQIEELVRRANAHDELLEACEGLVDRAADSVELVGAPMYAKERDKSRETLRDRIRDARAAIAKARPQAKGE